MAARWLVLAVLALHCASTSAPPPPPPPTLNSACLALPGQINTVSSTGQQLCIDSSPQTEANWNGPNFQALWLQPCNTSASTQQFYWDSTLTALVHAASTRCLNVAGGSFINSLGIAFQNTPGEPVALWPDFFCAGGAGGSGNENWLYRTPTTSTSLASSSATPYLITAAYNATLCLGFASTNSLLPADASSQISNFTSLVGLQLVITPCATAPQWQFSSCPNPPPPPPPQQPPQPTPAKLWKPPPNALPRRRAAPPFSAVQLLAPFRSLALALPMLSAPPQPPHPLRTPSSPPAPTRPAVPA